MAATAGQTRQHVDWYVITEDADLTLRITTGLKIGEDRWGELTLNHPVAANRWLEFTIDADGNLSARPCRRDIDIDLDGASHNELLLQAGDPISLPHNQIYISDSFRRGRTDATPAVVRCADMDDAEDDSQRLAQTVITESDVPASDRDDTDSGTRKVQLQYPLTGNGDDQSTSQTVRLEDSLYAARTTTSNSLSLSTEDSIETALIPVDAEPPFGTDELSAAMQRPIEITERIRSRHHRGKAASNAANSPILTPAVTEIVTERRNLTYLWTLSGILILGVLTAIVVATNSAPDARSVVAAEPAASLPAPAPASRAESLMASVENIIGKSDPDDLAAWEFAVRSYEYILAQEPDNTELAAKLSNARNRTAVLRAQQGIKPTFMPDVSESAASASLTAEPLAPETNRPGQQPAPAFGDSRGDSRPAEFPVGPVAGYEPLTLAQIEFRLDGAERRIASGEINNPVGISATSLILSVLGADPGNARAITLLNRAADRLVTQAEQAYSAGEEFQARNTLEEVFAFHPRFGPANQRWREWTGRPGPGEQRAAATP
jgi:hypothetical protein